MILPHHGKAPQIPASAYVAPSADVIGEVSLGEQSSVWFQVVIRGDVNPIRIGARTNIQDLSLLHCTRAGLGENAKGSPLTIGDDVTVGHRATLHGCTIGNRVLVGMGAIILDDAEIGDDCIIGAGALVTGGTKIPPGSLALGAPAKVARALKPAELALLKQSAANYIGDAADYPLATKTIWQPSGEET